MKRGAAPLHSRFGLRPEDEARLERLVEALAAEADPPTGIRDPDEALERHVADGLSALVVPELRAAGTLADVGAGAGFPGLPLAVALPSAHVDLVESSRRKCDVIERLALAAGIENARAIHARAEEWAAGAGHEAYDAVAVRAVGRLAVLVEYAAPLLRSGGSLVAWKGARDPAEEEAGARAATRLGMEPGPVIRVDPFEGARDLHLHYFRKERPTPEGFPRRAGMAAKRPLA